METTCGGSGMSDSYDDYEAKIQLAEHAWEEHVVKTEHDRAVELGKAYERGWNAALAQREWVSLTDEDMEALFLNEDGVRFARYIEAKLREKNT